MKKPRVSLTILTSGLEVPAGSADVDYPRYLDFKLQVAHKLDVGEPLSRVSNVANFLIRAARSEAPYLHFFYGNEGRGVTVADTAFKPEEVTKGREAQDAAIMLYAPALASVVKGFLEPPIRAGEEVTVITEETISTLPVQSGDTLATKVA